MPRCPIRDDLSYHFFVISKAKEELSQDSYAIGGGADPSKFIMASVSDGVSTVFGSGVWAKLISHAVVSGCDVLTNKKCEDLLIKEWRRIVGVSSENIPAATILSINIDTTRNKITAVSVGDSCLFLFQKDDGVYSWPFSHSSEFGDFVEAYVPVGNTDNIRVTEIEYSECSIVLLVTDGTAKALFDIIESGYFDKSYTRPSNLNNFLRKLAEEVNDDVTILGIYFDDCNWD